jgi:hypothetical protein
VRRRYRCSPSNAMIAMPDSLAPGLRNYRFSKNLVEVEDRGLEPLTSCMPCEPGSTLKTRIFPMVLRFYHPKPLLQSLALLDRF